MSWKNTLRKMPMPMNVATSRDEDFKQKIIAFEKEQIEPAFTKYTQGLGANSRILLSVGLAYTRDSKFDELQAQGIKYGKYSIGTDDVKRLGGDSSLILNTIKELYDKEGYTTQLTGTAIGDDLYIRNK